VKIIYFKWFFALFCFGVFLTASVVGREAQPPNIIIILADDFGVGDIQALYPDNKIATPCLDKLVAEGITFLDAHSSSAVCTPTRYGLLTGRYNWRTRLQEWVLAAFEKPLIAEERLTLPGMLQKEGYTTACIGKWHLGWDWSQLLEKNRGIDFHQPVKGGPITRGFDYYFGVDVPNMPPFTFIENDQLSVFPSEQYVYRPELYMHVKKGAMAPGWKFSEILPELTRRAVQYIHDRAREDKPFMLYFSMTTPHEPIAPSKAFQGKSNLSPIADLVMETDWAAGEVIQALDDAGIAENTILFFMADNGHSKYTGLKTLLDAGHKPSGEFRGYKGDIWEGGHRVPLIVKWLGKVKPKTTSSQLICLNDVFATCAEIVDAKVPMNVAEDSVSFLSLLEGKETPVRKSLVHHSVQGEFSIREEGWKLVYAVPGKKRHDSRGQNCRVMLYNLEEDIEESVDLSSKYPEVVQRLTKLLEKIIDDGRSTSGERLQNDCKIDFRTIQKERWGSN